MSYKYDIIICRIPEALQGGRASSQSCQGWEVAESLHREQLRFRGQPCFSLATALLLVEDLKIRRRVEFDPLPAFQHCHISAIFLVIFSSCQDETAPPEEVKAVSSALTKLLAELVRVVRSVRRWAGDGPEMGRRRLEHSANSESRRILLFSMVFHVEKCRFPRGLKYMGEVMMFWRYGWTWKKWPEWWVNLDWDVWEAENFWELWLSISIHHHLHFGLLLTATVASGWEQRYPLRFSIANDGEWW